MSADGGQLTRTLVAASTRLVRICTELSNQIRGLMKTFGLIVPSGKGATFSTHVRMLLEGDEALSQVILPILRAWQSLRSQSDDLSRQLIAAASQSPSSQLLMRSLGSAR